MFSSDLLGSRLGGIPDPHHLAVAQVSDDLFAEGQNSILVALLVLVDVDRRDLEGIVPFCRNFLIGDGFVVFLDVDHQHVEMEELFLLHTITFFK